MRAPREYVDGLARLHLIGDAEERRSLFRQSMATLAAEAAEQRPVPLEGLDPMELLASVGTALSIGLIDDLDFLSTSHAAAALYQLAAVLPHGELRRELGRRVAEHLHQGNAATFVALATQLAVSSRRALSGPAVRARVALSLELPIGSGARADALALALVSRRELAEEWLIAPASGSLPSRRLAARLLERAAREAARRCAQGDDGVLAVFERSSVKAAWERLLGDRESLVWRHVATARGLLSEHGKDFAEQIAAGLSVELTPTEWRRAAASLAASIAVTPERSLSRALWVLDSPLQKKDPGLAGAMLLGLPRAAEVEPQAAEELCTALVKVGGIDAAEALLELRHERVGGDFGAWACQMARAQLREQGLAQSEDDGLGALAEALDQDLRPNDERDAPPSLRMLLDAALAAFAEGGARAAYEEAQALLGAVDATLKRLESATTSAYGGRQCFLALRELDGGLLETSILGDLLTLGARNEQSSVTAPLNGFFGRLTDWLLRHERAPLKAADPITHRTLRIHRLRTLLHAVDADGSYGGGGKELRERRLRTFNVLIHRVREDASSPLERVVKAAAARGCDALLREEVGELSDIVLTIIENVRNVETFRTMAEASMVPEMENVFRAYALLMERSQDGISVKGRQARASLDALGALLRSLPFATSPRVDALHGALLAYRNAVERLMACGSIEELTGEADAAGSRVMELERATRLLRRLSIGARRRLGEVPSRDANGVAAPALRVFDIAAERAYRGDASALFEALASVVGALREDLGEPLAEIAAVALERVVSLPMEAANAEPKRDSFAPAPPKEAPLPPWIPPSRTLGGFYVLRALGSGAVGSVFVARRAEEKNDEEASRFALKVPEYSGAAARTLSEEEFLRLFREEAGALLAIPEHENLARLVTFDAGAKPKPILVMELVEGSTLERVIETRALDVETSFALLDGVAAGLAAMHQSGVGHLDLKPSNVILREIDRDRSTPVLVDFGLAGRHLRAGCGTASYGAPEIWGLDPEDQRTSPMPVDVYAFGCLAYEILTGRELVWANTDVGIVTAHMRHDGDFAGLKWLGENPTLAPLASALTGALRRDPRARTPIEALRAQLAGIAPIVSHLPWPLEA